MSDDKITATWKLGEDGNPGWFAGGTRAGTIDALAKRLGVPVERFECVQDQTLIAADEEQQRRRRRQAGIDEINRSLDDDMWRAYDGR